MVFSYLRTWHHLPGVRVCAVHKVPPQILEYKKQKVLDLDEDGIILSEKELVGDLETEWGSVPCKNYMRNLCFLIFVGCRLYFQNVWKNWISGRKL